MNDLELYFRKNNKRLIQKWSHYFEIYDKYFSRFRNQEVVILEIGVSHGGSLQMWKNYFGARARIYGIDINPVCKSLEEENIKIFIGSQSDRKFLRTVVKNTPPIDILIDDGGHKMTQQIASFEELFGHIKDTGIYLCEDLHTSYMISHGGGHKRRGTFIEYSKNFIDFLNAYHSEQKSLAINAFTQTVEAVHYYDSVLVIEKKKREKPYVEKTGKPRFHRAAGHSSLLIKAQKSFIQSFVKLINTWLRFFRL